jgi:molecular chaperone DnaJ
MGQSWPRLRWTTRSNYEKFREVTEAYEVLTDDSKRQLYDQFGHAGVDPNFQAGGGNIFRGGGGGGGGSGGGGGGFDFQGGSYTFGGGNEIDPEDLFDAFFGGGRRRPRGPRRGGDLKMHVQLTFEEAVFGASKDLHLRYQVMNQQGQTEIKERYVTVDTPPGIDNGMNLRLSGQGAEGDPGASPGNLLVHVIVEKEAYYNRDGADVHTEIPISVTQAILGGTVDVKTLTGQVEMKIPKGCQPETKLMLRGKSIQKLHGTSKGNQVVHLMIEIPKEITKRQEELLREFDEETKGSGKGISGRLAEAAGWFFGGNSKAKDKKSEKSDNATKATKEKKEKKENSATEDDGGEKSRPPLDFEKRYYD